MTQLEKMEKQLVHQIQTMPPELLRKWLVEYVHEADFYALKHLHIALMAGEPV